MMLHGTVIDVRDYLDIGPGAEVEITERGKALITIPLSAREYEVLAHRVGSEISIDIRINEVGRCQRSGR